MPTREQAEAKKLNARPKGAKISCGQLNTLNDEIMVFAFEAAAKDTICEGVKLEVVHLPLRATCQRCGITFDFDVYSPCCPCCTSGDIKIASDAPILLEEIEFEDKDV